MRECFCPVTTRIPDVLRERLISYWPVILLCAGGVVLPVVGALPLLRADGLAYPVRLELPPARGMNRTNLATAGLTDTGLLATLTDIATDEPEAETDGLAADSLALSAQAGDAAPGQANSGLLAINFNLADPSSATTGDERSSPIEARKGVRLDGVDVGTTAIRITSGSALFIARDDLRGLLSASGRSDLSERIAGGAAAFVSFDEIRRLGFGVRYDPVTDRILVST